MGVEWVGGCGCGWVAGEVGRVISVWGKCVGVRVGSVHVFFGLPVESLVDASTTALANAFVITQI